MKQNNRYLVFLKKNVNGQYAVIFNNKGKYNLDNKDVEDYGVENKGLKLCLRMN